MPEMTFAAVCGCSGGLNGQSLWAPHSSAIHPRDEERDLKWRQRSIVGELAVAASGVPLRHAARQHLFSDSSRPRPCIFISGERHRTSPAIHVASDAPRVDEALDISRPRDGAVDWIVRLDGREREDRQGPDECVKTELHTGQGLIAAAGCAGLKRMPVYCISSHVWSPHFTSIFGSGFDLFAAELSYQAVETIFDPFGISSGSLNM